ncbi:hypothetical protein ARMGADRAFT_563589 [Armillaria gallica]|uniref:Uncharacterized protein n=1 Tax=Armillaria gallica TaxID=47427 RepID=A0A2H3CQR1_ARMGA|nr:hypothetical protein ARMGADRAFT_563589 [Armillaria gallica]
MLLSPMTGLTIIVTSVRRRASHRDAAFNDAPAVPIISILPTFFTVLCCQFTVHSILTECPMSRMNKSLHTPKHSDARSIANAVALRLKSVKNHITRRLLASLSMNQPRAPVPQTGTYYNRTKPSTPKFLRSLIATPSSFL